MPKKKLEYYEDFSNYEDYLDDDDYGSWEFDEDEVLEDEDFDDEDFDEEDEEVVFDDEENDYALLKS